jgi:hypothetical protein
MNYKMFFIPFSLDKHDLVLCGFVKNQTYSAGAYQLPVPFIYTLAILFLLILVALPLIKPYLIGSQEPLRFIDLIGFMLSLFLGCTLLTIIIIQVVLLKDGDIMATGNLEILSKQINKSFIHELQKSYTQLDSIDNYVSKYNLSDKDKKLDISDTLNNYLESHKDTSVLNYNFDRLAWVNPRGSQIMKAALDTASPVYQEVGDRDYFTLFKNKQYYSLPDVPNSAFTLQPVYNRTNGEFRFILNKKSQDPNTFIVSSSLQLSSVMNVVLPAGYGFCIIDEEGNVMVHSAQDRNLNENLLNQTGLSKQLKGAIVSRQHSDFHDIQLYGRKSAMHVMPIDNLPFFLVTFYDKGYIVPVNLRILIFSLSFCFFSYMVVCICWLLLFWRQYYARALLCAPVQILYWIVPQYKFKTWYKRGAIFLSIYSIMLLLLTFGARFADLNSNYLILVIVLLTPVNILCGLFVIFYKNSQNQTGRIIMRSKRAAAALISLSVISILVVGYTFLLSYPFGPQLLIFQAITITGLAILYFRKPAAATRTETGQSILTFLKRVMQVKSNVYLVWYSFFWTVLLICLAVLPVALFTWYSHNQEILQSVKKQQLFFANALVKRKDKVCAIIQQYEAANIPTGLADTLQYKRGIYTIYNDETNLVSQSGPDSDFTKNFEEFYFEVANEIGNTYYDPQSFPALRDISSDTSWHWLSPDKNKLSLLYKIPPGMANTEGRNYLKITSILPPRYIMLGANTKGVLLAFICISLLAGLYKLIRSMAERFFLRKFFTGSVKDNNATLTTLINDYRAEYLLDDAMIESLNDLKNESNKIYPESNNNAVRNEQLILDNVEKYRDFYDFVWRKRSGNEQYLLYHFARHGIMNARNTVEIYRLIKKGVLVINEETEQIQLLSISFRAYILHFLAADEIHKMENKWKDDSRWYSFRMPLQVILLVVASFIFFTQQETWQRIVVLITGISSSLPFLLNIFTSGSKAVKKQE